ncbi:N-6 DNA methylase [Patescibacteria group bacterium]|nr:N-6 DNA methylase [Patescibacteria group bacterium]
MQVLQKLFSNPAESLSMFSRDEIDAIESKIFEEEGKYFLESLSRGKEKKQIWNEKNGKGQPEEIVRQLYINELIKKYKYPVERIDIEKSVKFGREVKRADIIIYKEDNETPHLIAEAKEPNQKNDVDQLKSYLNAEGAPFGVALNGKSIVIVYRPYPKDFDTLSDIPKFGETVDDVLNKRKTLKDLESPKQLKEVIQNMEELVLANSGFDSFEEIFKLIYAKLHDEKEILEEEKDYVDFRKSRDATKTKADIEKLFNEAKDRWKGVFDKSDVIKLSPEHLNVCVGALQDFRLLGANLQVIDEAFEYLIPDVAKGKKGQYFTPRIVIDMCVAMLQPNEKEKVIDTACGSAGFLIHTMEFLKNKHNWSDKKMSNYAQKYLYGIDFDEKASKIARAMMLIAGDGKSHIYKENSLDSANWEASTKSDFEKEELLREFSDYAENERNKKEFLYFDFDVLMANPPFAGEVKEPATLAKYFLGKKKGKNVSKISRHLLFIERNLNFVRDGGRLAIVLPQGVFNNTSEQYIREFIMEHARILAVVGIEGNSFKPHTGTKTSVIFLQKWGESNPKQTNYPIFFATSKVPFKNNSGDYVYKDETSRETTNLKNDLFDIAKTFVKWGQEQGFEFLKG